MDEEDQATESLHSHPENARKSPGINATSTNQDWAKSNGDAFTSNSQQIPTLKHYSLPPLPPSLPPGDSSLLYAPSDDGANSSDGHIDHGMMERHLMDVESSFMPALSPVSQQENQGADDPFLFEGVADSRRNGKKSNKDEIPTNSPSSPPTPPSAYKTPGLVRHDSSRSNDHNETGYGYTTSSLETMSSSPTAAAVARTISRTMSRASNGHNPSAKGSDTPKSEDSLWNEDSEITPKKAEGRGVPRDNSSDGHSTIIRNPSPSREESEEYAKDAGNTPGAPLLQRKLSNRHSRFLRSRHTSQQSSVSSFLSNPEEDSTELTSGTDLAKQAGNGGAGSNRSRPSSTTLSRSISLGSMASTIDDANLSGEATGRQLATLDEEERNRERKSNMDDGHSDSAPETPRASSRPPPIVPTDTVIAQHVKNVHVPESIAKEFRYQNGVASPGKRASFTAPTSTIRSRNLTLKEQSYTIERLSKENFDLKLKVMFLSDRLDKLSEEGVKEMISENVELKTGLAVKQRENLALKRKIRELEQKLKDDGERPQTGRSGASDGDRSPKWFDQEGAQEKEEELTYLRERVEEYVTEIEKLRNESMTREAEKRKLAEVLKSMGKRRGDALESREEMDVWKDLLEQETARREQADLDNQKLRDELFRIRSEATTPGGIPGLTHTTNIYNITKKRQMSPSRPRSGLSEHPDDRNGASSAATTLVDELRAESEQLRHENAELRREVGAQTSMLTSRNKERERLTAELEEIKLGQRRGGGSMAGDSILERSASRANDRSMSRDSGTRQTALADQEREDLENKNAELRDKINALKMQNQDLQRALDTCTDDYEVAMDNKKEAEDFATELQGELEVAEDDIQTLQAERNEALTSAAQWEFDFQELQNDAQTEIDALAAENEDLVQENDRLRTELSDTSENFNALQAEMRTMSEGVIRLEDGMDSKNKRIEELTQENEELNRELEEMEKNLMESNDKINRLTVQQESAQSEISFLREEQDGDKIKIGDLEAALKDAEASIQDEKERFREMEQRVVNERHQREIVGTREKQDVQKMISELNRDLASAKDESRRLRKSLSSREVEATEWKERLMELENNLREALGDLNGTRSSLLKSIASLQRELENTIRDLDTTKADLLEKERLIKHRDALLESHGLETRKLSDMLDKERSAHRSTKHTFESFQKTHQHTTRTMTQQETRLLELETGRALDRKKITTLENTFKDQLMERNNLLLALWNRLSALCGKDWAHNNSLIDGRALPTVEAVSTMLPGFSKNLMAAIKTIESMTSTFKTRVRTIEKDLSKAYTSLEEEMEAKCKKLDRLETVVRSGVATGGILSDGKAEISKLKDINRMLKAEVASLRAVKLGKSGVDAFKSDNDAFPSPSPSVPMGPGGSQSRKSYGFDNNSHIPLPRSTSLSTAATVLRPGTSERPASMMSTTSTSKPASSHGTVSASNANVSPENANSTGSNTNDSGSGSASMTANSGGEQRWIYRLRELERRLKAEREARVLDRNGARKRLEEGEKRNLELQAEVERGRLLAGSRGGDDRRESRSVKSREKQAMRE